MATDQIGPDDLINTITSSSFSISGIAPNTGISGIAPSTTWTTSPNTVWTTTASGTGSNIIWDGAISNKPSATIALKGEDADIDINGKSMKAWMEKVEERLNILTPNPEMEKDWDELRRLGEKYRRLEKKCKEKSDMWNKLKAMPKSGIK